MTRLVSVLMPAYNHEAFVRQAVESVLAQTHGDLEVIVIDDASADATWELLSAVRDPRLRLFRHEANLGAHATLNEALARASGDYLAILNSDDVFCPDRLERLLAAAADWGGQAGLAFTDVTIVDQDGQEAMAHPRRAEYLALRNFCATLPPAAWFLAGNPAVSTSNFFFSRSLMERTGAFAPLRYAHDWDWALRAGCHGSVVWLGEPLLRYRVHAGNTLSEDDRWRHVHENSYVQARALRAMGRGEAPSDLAEQAPELVRALLRNESMHPVSLLCFLTYGLAGVADERLLAEAGRTAGDWLLQATAEATGHPASLFSSVRYLLDQERATAAQAAMLDERWDTIQHMDREIADRDRTIAQQAAVLAERDRCIAGQAALIEDRWNTIQHMSGEVANRDARIDQLERAVASLEARLSDLNGRLLVRLSNRLEHFAAGRGSS